MKNKNIKAVFIDLDGTLLDEIKNNRHTISQTNISAIKKVQKNGLQVFVSTGRTYSQFSNFFKLVGSKYAIGTNGAQIIDENGKFLVEHFIDSQYTTKIVEIAKSNNFSMEINGNDIAYGQDCPLKQRIVNMLSYRSINNYDFKIPNKVNKILLWGKEPSKIKTFQEKMIKKYPSLEIIISMNGYTVEFISKKASKGKATEYIYKNLLGLTKKQVAHIGDSGNDVSTKDFVYELIIMENALDDVKKHATHIGPHYKNGGVAKILNGEYKENN